MYVRVSSVVPQHQYYSVVVLHEVHIAGRWFKADRFVTEHIVFTLFHRPSWYSWLQSDPGSPGLDAFEPQPLFEIASNGQIL